MVAVRAAGDEEKLLSGSGIEPFCVKAQFRLVVDPDRRRREIPFFHLSERMVGLPGMSDQLIGEDLLGHDNRAVGESRSTKREHECNQ
ncbi:MAG: hypothetical protein AB7U35_09030 [Sphingobium sp.]